MKLYSVLGSPNSRKVEAVIKHLQLDVEIEYLDFFEGDLNTPEFMGMNPNGMVPVLDDDGFILNESNAINLYLAGLIPGNELLPMDGKSRASINRWLCWELAHYNNAFGQITVETVLKPLMFEQAEPNADILEHATQALHRFARVLEIHLRKNEFMVGHHITLADYAVIHLEMFKAQIPFDWSAYPNVNAYYERMQAIPYWMQTAPEKPEMLGRRPAATA